MDPIVPSEPQPMANCDFKGSGCVAARVEDAKVDIREGPRKGLGTSNKNCRGLDNWNRAVGYILRYLE